jgi:predicted metal-dependent HD superfamily phosphohydrolase
MKLRAEEWEDLWKRIGAQGDSEKWFRRISEAYGEKQRAYHNAEHIAECLEELRKVPAAASGGSRDEVEMALWLHDVVYDPKRTDNEEQSAAFAREICREGKLPEELAQRVEELILVTKHNGAPADADGDLVVDIDLSILGKPTERFWRYERDVRTEYAFVPEEVFRLKRAEILETFLRRESIYHASAFRERYEKKARENLRASIARLRSG